ncbi:unnamed protein product [Rhizophagus irregularis]|nr:unnamed protein product [Rhizophagus irregularis]
MKHRKCPTNKKMYNRNLIINKNSVRLNQISYETTSSNLAHANIKGFFFFLVKFDGSLYYYIRKPSIIKKT